MRGIALNLNVAIEVQDLYVSLLQKANGSKAEWREQTDKREAKKERYG